LLTLRESSPDMTSATTSVSAVPVPRLCKNIQDVMWMIVFTQFRVHIL